MPHPKDEFDAPVSTRRLEAFTDGVFAIAATLLVLDLSVEALGNHVLTNDELWRALVSMQYEFLSFGISFALLAYLWSLHIQQFEFVARASHALIALNSARLLGVVFIPFATSLNSEFSNLLAGRLLLPITFMYVTIMGAIEWFYATNPARGLVEGLSDRSIRRSRVAALIAALVSVIVVLLAPFIGSWAFLAFMLNTFADRIPGLTRPRAGKSDSATPTAG